MLRSCLVTASITGRGLAGETPCTDATSASAVPEHTYCTAGHPLGTGAAVGRTSLLALESN